MLIFHGVGTGKTCSAVTISEEFRDMYVRKNKKIIILRPTENVEQGWRKNIYDIKKGNNQCTGEAFTNILKDEKTTFNHERNIDNKVKRIINKYYDFYGFQKFANRIIRDIDNIMESVRLLPDEDLSTRRENETIRYIKKTFVKQIIDN